MSRKLIFSAILYFILSLIVTQPTVKTAEASTMGFPFISSNSYYEPPLSINTGKTIIANNKVSYQEKEVFTKEIKETKSFWISAYNSFEYQTDSSPCIPASGDNICGRTDVVACPREYKLGTKFIIKNKEYVCLDRLSVANDYKIDIFLDKDLQGALNWGLQYLEVEIVK